jgi:hypothetical protein
MYSPWLARVEALAVFREGACGNLVGLNFSGIKLNTRELMQETSAPVSYNQLREMP